MLRRVSLLTSWEFPLLSTLAINMQEQRPGQYQHKRNVVKQSNVLCNRILTLSLRLWRYDIDTDDRIRMLCQRS